MKNWKIRTKLFFGFGVILFIFTSISAFSFWIAVKNKIAIDVLESKVIKNTLAFMEFQKDVIQIQQFLTDVSATGDTGGYDDANLYYARAKEIVHALVKGGYFFDGSMRKSIASIDKELDDYYKLGRRMANAYITVGAAAGNEMMKRFDPFAEQINGEIEKFVVEQKKHLSEYFDRMQHDFDVLNTIRVIATVISLVLAVLLTLFITTSILKPVNIVMKQAKAMAEGDFTHSIEFNSGDEMGIMAASLNNFITSLRGIIREIQEVSETTMKIQEEMIDSTDRTASASHEIAVTVASLKSEMADLNSEIVNVAEAEEKFKKVVEDLDNQIETQASATEEATASVEEMISSIRNVSEIVNVKRKAADSLVEMASERETAVEKSNEGMKELLKLTDEIASIAEIIMNIAKQTNILSMNAAIEAAHAGEAGKGFAVVADEIRKLAETSNENAHQIAAIIEKVTEEIRISSMESNESMVAFRQINTEIRSVTDALTEIDVNASELAEGGQQILEAMTHLNSVTSLVRENANEMRQRIEEIAKSLQNVSLISGNVVNGVTEIEIGTGEISEAMSSINQLAKGVGENSALLDREIKYFRI